MGYYRRGEEPPRKRPRIKPKIEPWVCGHWCTGCVYLGHMSLGYCCDYFYKTGQQRPEGESTRECSVRIGKKKRTTRVITVPASAADYLTYREISEVVRRPHPTVNHWGTRAGVSGVRIEGIQGFHFTVEQAMMILEGHSFDTELPERLNEKQNELLEQILKAREIPKR